MKKILLFSGGLDSWLADKLIKPNEKIYINNHSEYSCAEMAHINSYDDTVRYIDFSLGKYEMASDHTVPFRNLFFAALAAAEYQKDDIEIYLAANIGDEHVGDKSPEFAQKTSELLTYISQHMNRNPNTRTIQIKLPFSNMTKSEALAEYLKQGGNISKAFYESFSCYEPVREEECWHCQPCFRKAIAFAVNGWKFNDKTKDKLLDFYETKILPDWDNWSKYHKKEAIETQSVVARWKMI